MNIPLKNQLKSKEMKQTAFFNRSKSDGHVEKPKVFSPTPIRTNDAHLIDCMCEISGCDSQLDFTDFCNAADQFLMRKVNSHGTLSLESTR